MIRMKPTLRNLLSFEPEETCCHHYRAQQVGIAKFFDYCAGCQLIKEGEIFSYYRGTHLVGQLFTRIENGLKVNYQTIMVKEKR